MSKHEVRVVRLGEIQKHPNADALGIVTIFGGYTCVVRLGQFSEGDLVAYVEPDYVVPTSRPEFAFLARPDRATERIRVKRLRGMLSHGLLIQAPHGAVEGDDVHELLGVERYEPPIHETGGEAEKPPRIFAPVYDLEPLRKWPAVLSPGEPVVVTEKIHGCNGRWVYHDGRMWCGSRTEWKREDSGNLWWRALAASPWLGEWCMQHPGWVVYGEVYGQVQDLRYGCGKGELRVAVFDVLTGGVWMTPGALGQQEGAGLVLVPLVREAPYVFEEVVEMSRGQSLVAGADHVREGVVVKPLVNRQHLEAGRVAFKVVNDDYLERA